MIKKVITSKGRTGFFFDDQQAIKAGAVHDGEIYKGTPITEGFKSIRQAGESVSVMFLLDDGQIAYGDCAAVQYSGAGGRDPLFLAEKYQNVIHELVAPILVNRPLDSFRALAEEIDGLINPETGKPLHTALRYGLTQGILDAVAKAKGKLMVEVVKEEYGLPDALRPIPIFMQSGDNRYHNVDKMIIKKADILPHGLINHVATKLGHDGQKLYEYIRWLRERVMDVRDDEGYEPVLHLDVYGTIGLIFDHDNDRMADYLETLAEAADPLTLRIEGPMDMGERKAQMEALSALTAEVDRRGLNIELVADEWCNTLEDIRYFADNKAGHMLQIKTPDLGGINNTIEAVLYCKERGIGAYQGGTCNETDRSSQVCVHMAMATLPDQILAKPGMGVDEGYMIVYNEMQRILALKEVL